MIETLLKVTPLWLLGSLIPLIIVSLLQYYICRNKPKYALIIPCVTLLYCIGKCFLFYGSGAAFLEKEYTLALYFLVFVSDGSYFVVSLIEYFYFKHHKVSSENKVPFSKL